MLNHIQGLHHDMSIASDAQQNNSFLTHVPGLRQVKSGVN